MSEHKKSAGQVVLEAVEAWIGSWIVFPPVPSGQALVCALWALHTWYSPDWPATAYLHITSDGPGCGKTTLMEALMLLSRGSRLRATLRPLAVVRDIEEQRGAVTYFFDQVEALSSPRVTDEQAILLTGYRHGGEHGVSVGQKQMAFSTYCAKAFASIGDVARDIRSRSIIVRLGFGVPARDWSDNVMVRQGEANNLLAEVGKVLPSLGTPPAWTSPDWLVGREKEIWTPIYSIATALNLDAATMKRLRLAVDDFSEFKKTAETRSYKDLVSTGDKDEDQEYAIRALRDLAAALPAPVKGKATGNLWTAVAVERMREGAGPWRVFKGKGLDPDTLAALVGRFGVKPEEVRMVPGRQGKLLKGYHRDKVIAAVNKLAGE